MKTMPPHDLQRSSKSNSTMLIRQRTRERQKLLGLLAVVLLILVITFVRFGKTIPWGAR